MYMYMYVCNNVFMHASMYCMYTYYTCMFHCLKNKIQPDLREASFHTQHSILRNSNFNYSIHLPSSIVYPPKCCIRDNKYSLTFSE